MQETRCNQKNNINNKQQHTKYNVPKQCNKKPASYCFGSFFGCIAVLINNRPDNDKRCQKIEPTQSKKMPSGPQYFIYNSLGYALNKIYAIHYSFPKTPFLSILFGVLLVITGLFVWLIRWIKREKSYPLEPFGPVWDPVGQLLFWGAVLIGFGIMGFGAVTVILRMT